MRLRLCELPAEQVPDIACHRRIEHRLGFVAGQCERNGALTAVHEIGGVCAGDLKCGIFLRPCSPHDAAADLLLHFGGDLHDILDPVGTVCVLADCVFHCIFLHSFGTGSFPFSVCIIAFQLSRIHTSEKHNGESYLRNYHQSLTNLRNFCNFSCKINMDML